MDQTVTGPNSRSSWGKILSLGRDHSRDLRLRRQDVSKVEGEGNVARGRRGNMGRKHSLREENSGTGIEEPELASGVKNIENDLRYSLFVRASKN